MQHFVSSKQKNKKLNIRQNKTDYSCNILSVKKSKQTKKMKVHKSTQLPCCYATLCQFKTKQNENTQTKQMTCYATFCHYIIKNKQNETVHKTK